MSKAIDKAAGVEREVIGSRLGAPGVSKTGENQANGYSRGLEGRIDRPNAALDITAPATDAAQQWQGWGTALKPAFEPIVVARKPFRGTVAANVLEHGTGALNIDGCRIDASQGRPLVVADYKPTESSSYAGRMDGSLRGGSRRDGDTTQGRWPTNVALDEHQAAGLDNQSGILTSGKVAAGGFTGEFRANVYGKFERNEIREETVYGDTGGASRFFPVFRYTAKAASSERPSADGVQHPTVKPLGLMRWLVRLVTPPGGVVLDPFGGSGTTGEAAIHEHKRAILIEREPSYLPLIVARLSKPMEIGFDFGEGA